MLSPNLHLTIRVEGPVSEPGRATSRHPSSVRESFLSALDVVGGYREWDREMERVGVLYLTGAG
jgi:hypothetical protein